MNTEHDASDRDARAAAAEPHVDAPRYDAYLVIHKGLRALMSDTLVRVGRMDPFDDDDTREAVARIRELLALAETHLEHEDRFLHPAMEARAPGSTRHVEADHRSHREALARLATGCRRVESAEGAVRASAALELYRSLALFVAEDLVHMHAEETQNNAVLWATHSDAEIVAIVDRVVASIPPEKNAALARWMVAASAPAERARMLGHARTTMPAGAFAGMLRGIVSQLDGKDRAKLEAALA
jgi:hypothetical protein